MDEDHQAEFAALTLKLAGGDRFALAAVDHRDAGFGLAVVIVSDRQAADAGQFILAVVAAGFAGAVGDRLPFL